MGLFRRLGRGVERLRRTAAQAATDPTVVRCRSCGTWIPAGGERCVHCGHRPAHRILGVAPDAPAAVVKSAARERFKATHPDRGGSSTEFRRVKRARDRLLE
jgi:ribosomal protein L32